MDPLSITVSIATLCSMAVTIISGLSEYIDNVREAPTEVQALANELASLYSCLGHVKLALQSPRSERLSDSWKQDLESLVGDCVETLKTLQIFVNQAKSTETKSSANQIWKTVKFSFRTKKIEFIRRRIVLQNGVLSNLLTLLVEARTDQISGRLDEIHKDVKVLITSQRQVKETLVVLENDEATMDQAHFVLSDRRSKNTSSTTSETQMPPWMDSNTGQGALTRRRTTNNDGSLGQLLSEENRGHQAVELTRSLFNNWVDGERVKALTSKSWQIASAILRSEVNPGDPMHIGRMGEHQTALYVKLRVDRLVYITVVDDEEKTISAGGGLVDFYTFVGKISRDNLTTNIDAISTWHERLPRDNLNLRDNCLLKQVFHDISLKFMEEQSAIDFFECLETLNHVVYKSWVIHTMALANIEPGIKTQGKEELEQSTYLEMCKFKWMSKDLI